MLPTFLTIFLSNSDRHVTEVPVTPETLCRDVLELCKEPGEVDCYLAELWRGSERAVGDGERMVDVLQRWGQHRGEVRLLLRHQRPPGREAGVSRDQVMKRSVSKGQPPGLNARQGGTEEPDTQSTFPREIKGGSRDHAMKRSVAKGFMDRGTENGVTTPPIDLTLTELQDLAMHQQQQIDTQQQLLTSKEQHLRYLRLQEQRQQQQPSEQERLQQLRENAHNQEAKLRRVRALRGQVEQKRLSNSKLVEEIEQMSGLFHHKQRELLVAVARVEELSQQLEALRSSRAEHLPHHPASSSSSSATELERLCKELQLRNKLNQEQSVKLQQQKDCLSKKNLEVAAMDRRLAELRQRLWKKKAALQQKENLPVAPDSQGPQQGGPSRVAAVGPYIQSSFGSQGPPPPACKDTWLKATYPDGTATLPMPDSSVKPPPRPLKPASGFQTSKITRLSDWSSSPADPGYSHASTLPRMSSTSYRNPDGCTLSDQKGLSGSDVPPPVPKRTNHIGENHLRDSQVSAKVSAKTPPLPPVPSKPKSFFKSSYSTGTFPGKARPVVAGGRPAHPPPSHSSTLPLPSKQENPPAAAVRPFTPDPLEAVPPVLQKPQMVAASSIYTMYTQQSTLSKNYPPLGQGTLPRSQPRVYGKPLLPSTGGQPCVISENTAGHSGSAASEGSEAEQSCDGVAPEPGERIAPRPLSPTKLLPFLSNPHRSPSDVDLEALRRRLQHAPRPLKKRSSITEPEGPAGPNIQKLLYQKTTLAAMEVVGTQLGSVEVTGDNGTAPGDGQTPPPLPPRSPVPEPASCHALQTPLEEDEKEEEEEEGEPPRQESFQEEYPPYPPPPYPSAAEPEQEDDYSLQPPEVTGQVTLPPSIKSFSWTPLHCAASCNNVQVCKFLVESGAAVFSSTYSDLQTAADKCEEMEEGYAQCSQFLYGVQEKMGVMNRGVVYALWDYQVEQEDELGFQEGDCLTVLQRDDGEESEWWWARCGDREGYIPRNLLGLYLRIKPRQRSLA
ncbi:apoptosis-stimulating of p53 protein 2-like [Lampris incognitus]|uniref:apoptosis-stimulating of p53 protein 2-like n=1 Tax=Lampris incognitus TaxID=2546036 RepID=UPI0024B4F0B6|nr:apoptosis-stimulating of p53 protein 2-like [Lampris incognitus]